MHKLKASVTSSAEDWLRLVDNNSHDRHGIPLFNYHNVKSLPIAEICCTIIRSYGAKSTCSDWQNNLDL
jgi:hypothetical protein